MVTLPAELAEAIETYRFDHRIRTEAEAIRRLLERGLAAESGRPGEQSQAAEA
jgi:hypothetical protein